MKIKNLAHILYGAGLVFEDDAMLQNLDGKDFGDIHLSADGECPEKEQPVRGKPTANGVVCIWFSGVLTKCPGPKKWKLVPIARHARSASRFVFSSSIRCSADSESSCEKSGEATNAACAGQQSHHL